MLLIKLKISISILVFLLSGLCMGEPNAAESERLQRAENNLVEATNWFITDGLFQYLNRDQDKTWVQKKMRDDWSVATFSGPVVGDDGYDVRLIIKQAGVYKEIISLHHLGERPYYEYWLVKTSGAEWQDIDRSCRFMITKANDKNGNRIVLKDENSFFGHWEAETGELLELPLDNLELRYYLASWLYTDCYNDAELTSNMITINSENDYVKVKIRWWHRLFGVVES